MLKESHLLGNMNVPSKFHGSLPVRFLYFLGTSDSFSLMVVLEEQYWDSVSGDYKYPEQKLNGNLPSMC